MKTLLLGTASAMVVAGGAQAADLSLSVAEPVDYVRVCDAFGSGYWYIPGTDTCIAVSGKVKFETQIYSDDAEVAPDGEGESSHYGRWVFQTSADLNVEAKTQTDWGVLTAYVALTTDSDNTQYFDNNGPNENDEDRVVYLDEAFIQIGPLTLGYLDSIFKVFGGYTDSDFNLSDNTVDQIQLSWALNGFGVHFGVEDPRDRWGSLETNDMPDLTAALTAEMGGIDLTLAALYSDLISGDAWAVNGSAQFEAGMFEFGFAAMYADTNQGDGAGGMYVSDGWSVVASSKQNWQDNFWTALTYAYGDSDSGGDMWEAAFSAGWSPAGSLEFIADVAINDDSDWQLNLIAELPFGPNG